MENYHSNMMEDYFQIDWAQIKNDLEKINARTLFVELPEGLKQFIPEIDGKLNNFTVYYSGESIYGSCDTMNFNVNVDAVLHFGHAPIPNINYSKKTFFIELKRKMYENENLINSLLGLNCRRIGIVATVQYVPFIEALVSHLRNNGIEAVVSRGDDRLFYSGQVLGCDFSSAEKIQSEVECFVVLADGTFHATGVAISTGKDTFAIEPFSGKVTKIDAGRLLKSRYIQMEKARDAKTIGIIVSTKIGQYRISIAKYIKETLLKNGKGAFIILMNDVSPQKLANLNFDAYVSTACPRIALDDSLLYEKPVLTPQEIEMVLGIKEYGRYSIDRINFIDRVEKDL